MRGKSDHYVQSQHLAPTSADEREVIVYRLIKLHTSFELSRLDSVHVRMIAI